MDDKRLIELDPVVCTQDRLHEHQDDANEVSLSGYVSMQVQMRHCYQHLGSFLADNCHRLRKNIVT